MTAPITPSPAANAFTAPAYVRFLLALLLSTSAGGAYAQADVLRQSLGLYFADSLVMQELTTQRYARFKTDAMNVDMNGGMSREAFAKKWGHIYNIRQPHLYDGFLIPLQDWQHVTVRCQPLPARNGEVWMAADFTEQATGEHFRRNVKLVQEGGQWRIDDVWEVTPLQVSVTGDFNGDNQADTLTTSLTSRITNKPILVDTLMDYDSLIAVTVRQRPLLQLQANQLPPLLLNEGNDHVLGLDYLANIGNIDQYPGDEIAVIINAADWSSINACRVFGFRDKKWHAVKTISIREETIPAIRAGKLKPWQGKPGNRQKRVATQKQSPSAKKKLQSQN